MGIRRQVPTKGPLHFCFFIISLNVFGRHFMFACTQLAAELVLDFSSTSLGSSLKQHPPCCSMWYLVLVPSSPLPVCQRVFVSGQAFYLNPILVPIWKRGISQQTRQRLFVCYYLFGSYAVHILSPQQESYTLHLFDSLEYLVIPRGLIGVHKPSCGPNGRA